MKKVILVIAIIFAHVIMTSCSADDNLNNAEKKVSSPINSADYGGNNDPKPIAPPKP